MKLRVCWVPEATSKKGEFTWDSRMVTALAMVSQSAWIGGSIPVALEHAVLPWSWDGNEHIAGSSVEILLTRSLADISQGCRRRRRLSFNDARAGVSGLSKLDTINANFLRCDETGTGTKRCLKLGKNHAKYVTSEWGQTCSADSKESYEAKQFKRHGKYQIKCGGLNSRWTRTTFLSTLGTWYPSNSTRAILHVHTEVWIDRCQEDRVNAVLDCHERHKCTKYMTGLTQSWTIQVKDMSFRCCHHRTTASRCGKIGWNT